MNKQFIKKGLATVCAVAVMCSAAVPVLAATKYEDSIGSVKEDITNEVKVGQDTNQSVQSEYDLNVKDFVESEDATTHSCDVYATISEGSDIIDPSSGEVKDGSILVSVPKKVILGKNEEGTKYTGSYKVQVKGNIAGDSVITVKPDETFTMSQLGKDDITVNVSQPKQRFVVAESTLSGEDVAKGVDVEFNEQASAVGTMETTQATAGSWNGICNFALSME